MPNWNVINVTPNLIVCLILKITTKLVQFGEDMQSEERNKIFNFLTGYFFSLFETSQSLFWASFGLVDLVSFELSGIKSFTRFWALLMFGSYSVINIIVLLNMLIAMMSNSYQMISERSDSEWKFARSRLWISYFDDGDTLPPPFNLLPTLKHLYKIFGCCKTSHNQSLKVTFSLVRKL